MPSLAEVRAQLTGPGGMFEVTTEDVDGVKSVAGSVQGFFGCFDPRVLNRKELTFDCMLTDGCSLLFRGATGEQ